MKDGRGQKRLREAGKHITANTAKAAIDKHKEEIKKVPNHKSIVIVKPYQNSMHLLVFGAKGRIKVEGHDAFDILGATAAIVNKLLVEELLPNEEFVCDMCRVSALVSSKLVKRTQIKNLGGQRFDTITGKSLPVCEECMNILKSEGQNDRDKDSTGETPQ